MRKHFNPRLLTLLLTGALACCSGPSRSSEEVSAPTTPVDRLRKSHAIAIKGRDDFGLTRLVTEDTVLMLPGHMTISGKGGLSAWVRPLFNDYRPEETFEPRRTFVGKHLAYDLGEFTMSLQPVGGGEAIRQGGHYLLLAHRPLGGRWRISHMIWNNDRALEESWPRLDAVASGLEHPGLRIEGENVDAGIAEFLQSLTDAVNGGDLDATVEHYAPDGEIAPAGGPVVAGRAAIRAHYEHFFERARPQIAILVDETGVADSWGFARTQTRGAVLESGNGEQIAIDRKSLMILERAGRHGWQIRVLVFNENS